MQGIESAIAQKADGITFCITDQAMGPTVTDRLKAVKIPYVTINDNVKQSDGKDAPHVGIDTYGACSRAAESRWASSRSSAASSRPATW